MHGLHCCSLIHLLLSLWYPQQSDGRTLQGGGYHTAYLWVDQGSLCHLINLLSHKQASVWPEADVRCESFTTNHSHCRTKSSLPCYFLYLHHEIVWSDFIIGSRVCSAEGQMLPTRRQLCSASLRFLAWTYVGCRGLRLSQAVALLGASWCEWMEWMWLVDRTRAVLFVFGHLQHL